MIMPRLTIIISYKQVLDFSNVSSAWTIQAGWIEKASLFELLAPFYILSYTVPKVKPRFGDMTGTIVWRLREVIF